MTTDETPVAPTTNATGAEESDLAPPARFGRRAFIAGAAASAVPVVAIGRGLGELGRLGGGEGGGAATGALQTEASPAASPLASPAASPVPVQLLEIVDEPQPEDPGPPVAGGELRLALTAGDNIDFSPVAFRQDFQIMTSYLDPLVWIDEVTMEPKPWLSESWEWNDDSTVITYTLRDDARWHDGDRLSVRDVIFSFTAYRDDVDSAVRNLFSTMQAVDGEDRTVTVTLTEPDGNWLRNASSQFIFQRKQYADHWSARPEGERTLTGYNWRENAPIGTGPWKVGKRNSEAVVFAPNEEYWAGPPHAEQLTLATEADPAVRLARWSEGDFDLLWPVAPADLPAVMSQPGRLYLADAASVMFAAFNFDNPARARPDLLADSRLRRALNRATNRERYAKRVFAGYVRAERAGTVAQPWAHDEEAVNPDRDLDAAKELLARAGFEDRDGDGIVEHEDGTKLELSLIVRNDAKPELIATCKSLVRDFGQVAVKLEVRPLSPEQFDDHWINTHDFDLIAYAYNLFPGFTDFDLYGSAWDIRQNIQGWNPGGYHNSDVDNAIRDILGATDPDEQRDALVALQRAANEDLFGLWFGFPRDLILVRPDIRGFQPNIQWQTWDTRKLWRT